MQISSQNKNLFIIFVHGLMSSMESTKALMLEQYCAKAKLNYIRFSNFGSSPSSGQFTDQTIDSWLDGLEMVTNLPEIKEIILIGSSLGGWLVLEHARKNTKVKALITLAAAPDCTDILIYDKLSKDQKKQLTQQEVVHFNGNNDQCHSYPISYNLIESGRRHLLLGKPIDLSCPVCLIHGVNDSDVPYNLSLDLAKLISHEKVYVKLIKDADHKLSRDSDMHIITNTIEELLTEI